MGLLYFFLEIVGLFAFVIWMTWAHSAAPWLFKAGAFAVLGAVSFFGLRFMGALDTGASLFVPIAPIDVSSAANGIERVDAVVNNFSASLTTFGPLLCAMMVVLCMAFHCAEILGRKKKRA